jgi:GT2 family glycosyltransferase
MDSLVYVIVLNWNLKDDTMACVESIQAGTYSNQRIVVVDNGSQDDSVRALAEHFGTAIDLIPCKENLGFAGGANVGIRHALARGADYVLLLNNDAIAASDLIEILVNTAASCSRGAVLGPAICYYDEPQRFWHLGAVHKWGLPVPVEIGHDTPDTGQFAAPFEVDYITGCAMWVPAQIFETVGLLNQDFFMYYEDADFCWRVREAGFRVVVVPKARIWHKISRSSQQVPRTTSYHHTRNRVIFYNRRTRGFRRVLANGYILATTAIKILRSRRDRELAACLWQGLVAGWREKESLVGKSSGELMGDQR